MKLVYSFYFILILCCSLPIGSAINPRSIYSMTSRQKYAEPVFSCPFTGSGCHRVLQNKSGQSQHKGTCQFNPVNTMHRSAPSPPPLPSQPPPHSPEQYTPPRTPPPHSPEQYTPPRAPTGPRTPCLGGSGTPCCQPPTPFCNSPQRQPPLDIISVEHHPHLNGECKI
jgi:hypothetical protein